MLLAIDSATKMLSIALHDGRRILAERTWETTNRHTVELTPALETLCTDAGVEFTDLNYLAVCQGPGSFSGLRIGISAAKGLAMALAIPLVAIPTLDITAAGTPFAGMPPDRAPVPLVAVAQVGRGRVCVAEYHSVGSMWERTTAIEIVAWDALLSRYTTPVLLSGEVDDGALALLEGRANWQLVPAAFRVRRASVLADLAWQRIHENTPLPSPAQIIPIYVNQPGLPHP